MHLAGDPVALGEDGELAVGLGLLDPAQEAGGRSRRTPRYIPSSAIAVLSSATPIRLPQVKGTDHGSRKPASPVASVAAQAMRVLRRLRRDALEMNAQTATAAMEADANEKTAVPTASTSGNRRRRRIVASPMAPRTGSSTAHQTGGRLPISSGVIGMSRRTPVERAWKASTQTAAMAKKDPMATA